MAKTISRGQFLKGLMAGAAVLGIAGTTGCTAKDKNGSVEEGLNGILGDISYKPGTYEAVERGMESDVKVVMTFSEKKITDVKIDTSKETANIGAKIAKEMEEKVLSEQSADIDAVTGATVTSTAIRKAVASCISQASGIDVSKILGLSEHVQSADWLGSAPEIDENDIVETIDCEVLVVGAGSSGVFAAATAAEEGAKTILIEKFPHEQASGIRDTLAACGSREQLADGDDVDKTAVVNYICNWSQGYTRRSLAALWAEHSGETIDWFTDRLAEGGMAFRHEIDDHSLPSNYPLFDTGHSTQYGDEYSEVLTMDKVLDYAYKKGLETHYEVTMQKLEKNADGRVTGLIAKNADSKYVRYNASKGTIIATGGYSANEEMLNALQNWTLEQTCVNFSKPGAKGDGIKALMWIGAVMDTTHCSMIFDRGAVKPDQVGESLKKAEGALFWMGSQPFLKVNLKAERFMNEAQPYDYVLHQAAMQPRHTYATVWDAKYQEDIKRFETHGCSRLYSHMNGTSPVFPMEMVAGMNAGLQEDGFIVEADTLEELADKLGLPQDTFMQTVERYNTLAFGGKDTDFGKEDYRLSTLTQAPFYGVRQAGGYLICTMDGIQMDNNMHPIDAEGNPIAGVYVVGNDSGNFFSGSYPNLVAGIAAGRSATFARLAAKNAVNDL